MPIVAGVFICCSVSIANLYCFEHDVISNDGHVPSTLVITCAVAYYSCNFINRWVYNTCYM